MYTYKYINIYKKKKKKNKVSLSGEDTLQQTNWFGLLPLFLKFLKCFLMKCRKRVLNKYF